MKNSLSTLFLFYHGFKILLFINADIIFTKTVILIPNWRNIL